MNHYRMQAESATYPWDMLGLLWEKTGSESPRISVLISQLKTQEASKRLSSHPLLHTILKPTPNYSWPQTWDCLHLSGFPPFTTGQWKREKVWSSSPHSWELIKSYMMLEMDNYRCSPKLWGKEWERRLGVVLLYPLVYDVLCGKSCSLLPARPTGNVGVSGFSIQGPVAQAAVSCFSRLGVSRMTASRDLLCYSIMQGICVRHYFCDSAEAEAVRVTLPLCSKPLGRI